MMALIKCLECGKQFSDKAPACPECGCPTVEMLKANKSTASNTNILKKSKEADAAISAAVKKTRKEADEADKAFDSASFDIQRKASRDIDLFGGDAPKRIVEIRADAKRACDDLYSTYQTLIPVLDATCRPLLADTPSREIVRLVAECIKYLNDESEIENNFTASFNSYDLGNVASAKYVPSMENKMIQKFWESQVSSSLTEKEIRTKYETQEEKTARLKAEEAQRKAEVETKVKIDNIRRQYDQAVKKWEAECEQISAKRNNYVNEKLTEEKETYLSTAKKKRDEAIQRATEIINQETKRKSSAETALTSLGAFKFGKKKEKKWTIEYASKKISEAQAKISTAQFEYSSEVQQADTFVNSKKSEYQAEAERKFSLPAKPSKPTTLIDEEKRQREENRAGRRAHSGGLTARQQKNEYLKDAIIDYLLDSDPMTVSEMLEEIPDLYGETNQSVSALLRQLVLSGEIEKFSEKRRTYFRIS